MTSSGKHIKGVVNHKLKVFLIKLEISLSFPEKFNMGKVQNKDFDKGKRSVSNLLGLGDRTLILVSNVFSAPLRQ